MGLLDWFRPSPRCPIEPAARAWVDDRWAWLEAQFGADRPRAARVVLPRPGFFPDAYQGTDDDVRRMLDRVCGYMGLDPAGVELSLYEDRNALPSEDGLWHGTAGLYHPEGDGTFRVWIEDANLDDPLALVATMAHELAHVHLLGHGRITGEEEDHEPLTDLLTVYLGMGVMTANAVVRETNWREGNASGWTIGRQGYLTMPIYGYALARFARARGEAAPPWSRELRPDVRAAFKQGVRFLAAEAAAGSDPAAG